MSELSFKQVIIIELLPQEPRSFEVPAGLIWKIESAGIGGTNGSIFLLDETLAGDNKEVAIIFSTAGSYGSQLPFSLPAGFQGRLSNNSSYHAIVSVGEYELV